MEVCVPSDASYSARHFEGNDARLVIVLEDARGCWGGRTGRRRGWHFEGVSLMSREIPWPVRGLPPYWSCWNRVPYVPDMSAQCTPRRG